MLRYAGSMAGSRKDVRPRLQRAALELYAERGFDRTTAADIAALAGVTERTYFRHFPDKRGPARSCLLGRCPYPAAILRRRFGRHGTIPAPIADNFGKRE